MQDPIPSKRKAETPLVSQRKFCIHCGKHYVHASAYKKHIVLCAIVHKTDLEREMDHVTSFNELVHVVQHLVKKCNDLETKMDGMMKYIHKEKKKLNFVDWLHRFNPHCPDLLWKPWNEEVQSIVEERHVMWVHEQEASFWEVLNRIVQQSSATHKIPLITSPKHDKMYFMEEPGVWNECNKPIIVSFFNGIQKRLLYVLGQWKVKNKTLFEDDDRLCEMYNRTMMKMLLSFTEDTHYYKVRRILIHHTKLDMKQLVEYAWEEPL